MLEEKKVVELSDDELENVNGGMNEFPDSEGFQYNGYNVVDLNWGCPCTKEGHTPEWKYGKGCACCDCKKYKPLSSPINNWHGYCTWRKIS